MSRVSRYSEPVPPTGGLRAQGLANLLGAPPIGPLSLVLREAAQNIWDARLPGAEGTTLRMLVRARTLTENEADALRALLNTGYGDVVEPPEADRLTAPLNRPGPLHVLEICDFGTEGLSGGVDPTEVDNRFVKFFFDIGATHFDGTTGGTYGFGRSSLYLASQARTIVVDSMTADGERRFMACRLGESFVSPDGSDGSRRYTGRHFWGACPTDRSGVEPLTGDVAQSWSSRLGLPRRASVSESGTSILIPWPETEGASEVVLLPQILYRNLWPKLVPEQGSTPPMQIEVQTGAVPRPLSIDDAPSIYLGFADALEKARTRRAPAQVVGSLRPVRTGGHLAVTRLGRVEALPPPCGEDDPLESFRGGLRHVALMRSSELVVTYREVDTDHAVGDWVGVLLADADMNTSRIFAASEPPAHDDWVPSKLKGQDATLVRKTLERMPGVVRELLGINAGSGPPTMDAPPLSDAADYFAQQFLAGDGTGIGEGERRDRTPTGNSPRSGLKAPEYIGLDLHEGQPVAEFLVHWGGPAGTAVQATPAVALSGGVLDEAVDGMRVPHVLGWRHPDGSFHAGERCAMDVAGDYVARVVFEGSYAVLLDVAEVEP